MDSNHNRLPDFHMPAFCRFHEHIQNLCTLLQPKNGRNDKVYSICDGVRGVRRSFVVSEQGRKKI